MARMLSILCLVLFGLSLPAAADWSPLKRVGSTRGFVSTLSCGETVKGSLSCLARFYDGQLFIYDYNGKWKLLRKSGSFADAIIDPVCTKQEKNWESGFVFCAWADTSWHPTRNLEQFIRIVGRAFGDETFNFDEDIEADIVSNISCAVFGIRVGVLCAWRNITGSLVSFDTENFRLRSKSSAKIQSDPSCAPDGNGGAICAAIGENGNVLAFKLTNSPRSEWAVIDTGGVATSAPSCVSFSIPGQVVCTVRGLDLGLYANRFVGGEWKASNWQGWANLGGKLKSAPGCADLDGQKVVCAVIGVEGSTLYVNTYDGAWRGSRVGEAKGIGQPECSRLDAGKALCTMLGIDGYLYYTVGP